jgi:hypothetical protein
MSTFYSIRIPTPELPGLQQLAQFISPIGLIEAYWMRAERQVVIRTIADDSWFVQPNGKVIESLSSIIGISSSYIVMRDLFLFEEKGHGKLADNQTQDYFYDCEWSDYASDFIAIQAVIDYPEEEVY